MTAWNHQAIYSVLLDISSFLKETTIVFNNLECIKQNLTPLNSFPRAYSALIGQMAEFVVIHRPLTMCVGSEKSISTL